MYARRTAVQLQCQYAAGVEATHIVTTSTCLSVRDPSVTLTIKSTSIAPQCNLVSIDIALLDEYTNKRCAIDQL